MTRWVGRFENGGALCQGKRWESIGFGLFGFGFGSSQLWDVPNVSFWYVPFPLRFSDLKNGLDIFLGFSPVPVTCWKLTCWNSSQLKLMAVVTHNHVKIANSQWMWRPLAPKLNENGLKWLGHQAGIVNLNMHRLKRVQSSLQSLMIHLTAVNRQITSFRLVWCRTIHSFYQPTFYISESSSHTSPSFPNTSRRAEFLRALKLSVNVALRALKGICTYFSTPGEVVSCITTNTVAFNWQRQWSYGEILIQVGDITLMWSQS